MPDANLFPTDEVIQLALTDDFSMDSVTSGSDPNLWDPIQILDGEQADEPQKKKEEKRKDTDGSTAPENYEGVTSGADSEPWVKVKSSERKYRHQR